MGKEQSFTVRDYWAADYPHVADIWERTGMNTPGRDDSAEVIENSLRRNGRLLVMVDKASDTVVGTSWLTNDGRRLYLHHFAIDPRFQGGGLSKPLMRESLKIAKEIGLQIKLEVHCDNEKAVHFYEKAGFKRLGDYDIYIIRDLNEIKE
ncbi:MAG: GNAT family N-acetyltransferase [Candidatus Aminicenantes bacterium]|nr:GNAT family N-acetyltransferase [Candidatus Aminicenantes bacterium]